MAEIIITVGAIIYIAFKIFGLILDTFCGPYPMINLDDSNSAIETFLRQNDYVDFEVKKIAGDASFRSYYRITNDNQETDILMFAPPEHENMEPFINIDQFLLEHNFFAPKIYAIDQKKGFLLLEDLGDDTYGRVLAKNNAQELELYKKACDCLLDLHKIKDLPKINNYNNKELFREVMLFVDWYLPLTNKKITLAEKAQFKFLWFQLFDLLDKTNQVLVLRDYHADNLMVLKNKEVGLLDFQDALIGSRAYDLVSLLEDARRDVDTKVKSAMFDYYLKTSALEPQQFTTDYAILSLQRNIKILGIFARLSKRDGKKQYLTLIPRVLDLVKARAFSNDPILFEIGNFLKKFL